MLVGFSGSVNLGCDSSTLPGVSCSVSPSSQNVSSSVTNVVVTIQSTTSATAGTGTIVVSGTSGSIALSSAIPVTILTAGGKSVSWNDGSRYEHNSHQFSLQVPKLPSSTHPTEHQDVMYGEQNAHLGFFSKVEAQPSVATS